METTVLSLGKSVVNGALSYAKSAIAEEVALQLGVQRDQAFITDELEMMQGFLMAAHDKRDDNKVVKIWVKQVSDVAYDVEDCLQDFAVRFEKRSWWRIPRMLLDRRQVAKEMKELRAKVEDVSQRNLRYRLNDSGNEHVCATGKSTMSSTTMFAIDEARRAAKQNKSEVDIVELINKKDNSLRVVAVWGASDDLGQTSIIRAAYENPDVETKFPCRAWVRMTQPFSPKDFIQSLVEQFQIAVGVDILLEAEKTGQDLAKEFNGYLNEKRYLIVINNLSTIEEWDRVKRCLPDNIKGSRILVSTTQLEVACLCAGKESIVSELKQFYTDQSIYAFHGKDSQDGTDLTSKESSSNGSSSSSNSTVPMNEILEDQPKGNGNTAVKKSVTRMRTMIASFEESHLVGRKKEKYEIIRLISYEATQPFQVISVWGMGGLGKTTLVKDIYQSQELDDMFEKRACVTVMRPFVLEELLRSLVLQLSAEDSEKRDVQGLLRSTKKTLQMIPVTELITELAKLLGTKRCLIVLDDISSVAEWDMIMPSFHKMGNTSRIIVTTREEKIAKHCSERQENIYMLKGLDYKDGRELFTKMVFKEKVNLDEQYPELVEQADLVMRKCSGLPLAIVVIGGFLSNQPINAAEWRKLNEHISAELEMNSELETIRTVLLKSFDGLPYHLKVCFLYLSIFPEDHKASRRRLVRRWTAEGYSREVRGKSAVEIADMYFMELISRSMILPNQRSAHSRKIIDSCQVHDLIREIGISKSLEENLVFTLEEGCSLNHQGKVRHLAISSNWKGDQSEFESTYDMYHVRSLTVFGKWRPFYISEKMRLLRVLDLENTSGLVDHHLEHIGKLLHLRFLSLRRCCDIDHLPDSFGNLRQLETLDVKGTSVAKMPRTIIKLKKLQHILAGRLKDKDSSELYEQMEGNLPMLMRNKLCTLALCSMGFCVACCAPRLLKNVLEQDGDVNRRDVCTVCCCGILPFVVTRQDPSGVAVPRGIRKLKALRTLSTVDVSREKTALEDIKRLTQLRKLGVSGVNKGNSQELCSALADLTHLESLLVRSEEDPGLSGCLDILSLPPQNLQSLKLCGNLVKLPEWIQSLKNLVKLKLRTSNILEHEAALQVLGNLPNLAILCLRKESFTGEDVRFCFHREAFPNLVVLEMDLLFSLKSVVFDEGATPKLELLQFCASPFLTNSGFFSGLSSLTSLREFMLDNDDYEEDFVQDLRDQLAENKSGPVLKRY